MSKRKFTPEQDAEIARRYVAGESSEQIALDILPGEVVSDVVVRLSLKYNSIPLRAAAHKMNPVVTEEQRERAVVMCEKGSTIKTAARACGVSPQTVKRALRAARGIDDRVPKKFRNHWPS